MMVVKSRARSSIVNAAAREAAGNLRWSSALMLLGMLFSTVASAQQADSSVTGEAPAVTTEAPAVYVKDASAVKSQELSALNQEGYKVPSTGESEFDNQSDSFVKDWREATPVDEYEDTEFGELIYNEASTPTKLEILRLLSKDTPSMMVFLTAISMGIDIENVLQASVKYEPEKSRDLAASAVNILPLLSESSSYLYSGYELEDLEREDESKPYSVEKVVEKFFKERSVLRPYPDWFEGQYHFLASAAELKRLQAPQKDVRWYRAKSTEDVTKRPIFVSLYEATNSVLIDGEDRINEVLRQDPNAQLPVVFVFNRLNERAVDQLGYKKTIRGVQDAYVEKSLMLTPSPEWQLGEYHFYASTDEVDGIFNLPKEDDFEPEAWQKLLEEAEDYSVTNTSFLFVVLGGGEDAQDNTANLAISNEQLYAAWDDPRSEEAFPYVAPKDGPPVTLENIVGQGLIFNRPDLIAALITLGVKTVPVSFYYIDNSRMKPFIKGPRALIQAAIGLDVPHGTYDGGGITPPPPPPPVCASPPCTQ